MIERSDSFTPSNNTPEFLETIFVQRHKLLEKSVAWSKDSIFNKQKKHLLFIGPRGSGKTHLISMIVNRLKQQAGSQTELQDKMLIVWLGEDDIITNFLDLMLSILTTLVQTYPEQFHDNCLKDINILDIDAKADRIMHSINEQLGNRTIVLIKENLSDVFRGLKDSGQKKFRSFLQEERNTLVLATSQQLFDGIASRDAAFFGFFDTHHLKPLDREEAMQLVRKLAVQKGDQKLLDFLKTPQGCFRMRALHYLAGGNHRLYIHLLDFLTMESFDDLVSAMQDLVVDLTPYFQERIRSLPAQQGKIIQKMCAIQGAVPVKELAAQTMIDERGAAKQLGELARKKYVLSHKRGKLTYYEVAEPLMRLSLEVKSSRGKPLKILVSLLRAWFSDEELQIKEHKLINDPANHLFIKYKSSAFQADKKILRDMHSEIKKEMQVGMAENNHKSVIQFCNEMLNTPLVSGEFKKDRMDALWYRGIAYSLQGDIEKAIQDYSVLIDLEDISTEQRVKALLNRGVAFSQQGNTEKGIQDYSALINLEGAPTEARAMALLNRGITYSQQGKTEKAVQDYSALIDLEDAPIEQRAKALLYRGVDFSQQGKTEKGIQDCSVLIDLEDISTEQRVKALLNRGVAFSQQGETEKGIQDYSALIDLEDAPIEQRAKALLYRGMGFNLQGDTEKAIQGYSTLVDLKNAPSDIQNMGRFAIPELYFTLLDREKAHNALKEAFIQGDKKAGNYPTNITGILVSIIGLGSSFWQKEIHWLLVLFKEYDVLAYLGTALIKSASAFVNDPSLLSSLKKWQLLWQDAGEDYEEISISLQALAAMRLAIEQKNDKPLLRLAKEVRELVQPLVADIINK